MKARRLIGDDAFRPQIIKTIHRVGHRFVAPVEEIPEAPPAAPASGDPIGAAESPSPRRRIAVLPIKDHTDRRETAWFDLGLMSATNAALACSHYFTIVPAAEILAVAERRADSDDPALAGGTLLEAVGASDLVQASIRADAADGLTIRFVGQGRELDGLSGELNGFEAIELCRQLARIVVSRLEGVSVDELPNLPRL